MSSWRKFGAISPAEPAQPSPARVTRRGSSRRLEHRQPIDEFLGEIHHPARADQSFVHLIKVDGRLAARVLDVMSPSSEAIEGLEDYPAR
jgi:hypothetical protein